MTQFVHSTLSEYDSIPISIQWGDPSAPGIVTWNPGESNVVVKSVLNSPNNDIYMLGFGPKTLELSLILLQEDYSDFLDLRQGEGYLIVPSSMADGTGDDVVIQGEIYHKYLCSLIDVRDPIFITNDESVELTASFMRS